MPTSDLLLSASVRWLHALALVGVSCTPAPPASDGAAEAVGAAATKAPRPTILPTRSLAIETDRSDLAPPLSLTASDGTGLRLVSLHARAVVQGPLAFTELRLEFENPLPRRIEGRFEIELPGRAAISRFAMKLGDAWQEGEVVERQAARRAYEDFLHRRQDPALLEHDAGNRFGARVFPIEANARKELIVSYSQELVHDGEPYRLPLRGLPSIASLDVSATLAGSDTPATSWVESNVTPDHDFEVELAARKGPIAIRSGAHALARVAVTGPEEPVGIGELVVLFDTSASRAIGFDRRIRRLGGVLRALEADVGAPIPLRILGFDQTATELFTGTTATLDDAALAAIASRRALGASDLAGALRAVGQGGGERRVLVVTDGVATTGATELVELERAANELAGLGVTRIDAIADGSGDDDVLATITTAPAMAPGVVVDARSDDAAAVHELRTVAFEALDVTVPGATWVWPERIEGVQPGDEVLVYAELPEGAAMRVGLGEGEVQSATITEVTGPLLRRASMRALVQRLTDQRSRLLVTDAQGRDALQRKIVELSVRERVLSEFTALLVLEREADYARFGIDRRALADILAIGPGGVELVHRDGQPAALAIADMTVLPEAPEWLAVSTGRWGPGSPKGGIGSLGSVGRGAGSHGEGAFDGRTPVPGGSPGAVPSGVPRGLPGGVPGSVSDVEDREQDAEESGDRGDAPADPAAIAPATGDVIETAARSAVAAPPAEPMPMIDEALEQPMLRTRSSATKAKRKMEEVDVGLPRRTPPMPELAPVTIGAPVQDGDLLAADIASTLDARRPQFGWCAMHATPEAPMEFGALELQLVVDGDGAVTLARLRERGSLDARLTHCLEHAASGMRFAAGKPGEAPVVIVPVGVGATKPKPASLPEAAALEGLRRDAAAIVADRLALAEAERKRQAEREAAATAERKEAERTAGSPYTGKFFDVMTDLTAGRTAPATELALAWQLEQPGDVLALVALGEVAEKAGDTETASRAYGSIIDLFPGRADLRRYASNRLARVGGEALVVAIDSARAAVASRPDHPSSHRALAFALVAAGQHREAARAIVAALHAEHVPWERFSEVQRILREDLGLIAAAWVTAAPASRGEIEAMVRMEQTTIATSPSLRFVLTWETDANDVDFHIHDGKGGHAFFSDKTLPSGGSLYADITTGYGPECFAIEGTAAAYPYNLRAHYYARGPMGYGMGRVQAVQHDGKGGLVLAEYPFVVMKDQEWIDLGTIKGPLGAP
jgi:hypothetical protein